MEYAEATRVLSTYGGDEGFDAPPTPEEVEAIGVALEALAELAEGPNPTGATPGYRPDPVGEGS